MDYRVGKCSSCGARYKIPATFGGDKAKCKSCSGVVEVGPVQTPGTEPGAKPKAQPIPARKPAEKKERSGPSMKEKLKAQREAAAAAAAGATAAKPAAKSEPKAERSSSRRSAGPRRARATAGGGGDEEPKRASKRTSARGGSRRGRGGDDDDGGEPRSRRGRPQKKKANPAMFIGAIALVAIVAFGAWKFMGSDEGVEAGNGTNVAMNEGTGDGAAENATDGTTGGAGEPLVAPTDESENGAGETPEDAPEGTPEGGAEAGGETPTDDNAAATEEPVKPKPAPKVSDPSTVDLSVFDFGKVTGTTDEEWAEYQEMAALIIDPEAGAAGNRARKNLIELGKPGFPAVLNVMLTMDFSTEEGYRDGDIMQRTLMEMCNGTNLGWKYSIELKDQTFNKKVVRGWAQQWDRAKDSDEYWQKLAKLDKKAEVPKEAPAVSEDDLDDLDDL